jgi:aflatoxin B1 aldehyde reductase
MTFGWSQASTPVTKSIGIEMISHAYFGGVNYIDSARIYSGGATEPLVGECLKQHPNPSLIMDGLLKVTTKAHPSQANGLSTIGLEKQLKDSLTAMGLSHIDEFYLHQPDPENDLKESLQAVNSLYEQGLIRRLGMSNYHEAEVERAVLLCRENNWIAPTIYQGLYNPLNRKIEKTLLPILRKYNIDFIAFNALAAGLLTGKHTDEGDVPVGRFKDNINYLPRFYTKNNFNAIELIKASLPDVSFLFINFIIYIYIYYFIF